MTKTILVVWGTRPESLKLAGPVREMQRLGLQVWRHCTGQSHDLLDQSVLPWDSFGPLTADLFKDKAVTCVEGDTFAAWEGAYQSFLAGVPVFQIEAGVRSGRLDSPFPEEGLRKCISQLATFHCATTEHNYENLQRERLIRADKQMRWNVKVTGSPIVESVRLRAVGQRTTALHFVDPGPLVVVTLHRRENQGHFGDILAGIQQGVSGMERPDVRWYSHPNGWAVKERTPENFRWAPLAPLDANHFAQVLDDAALVISDSGGVIEEASCLGIPSVQAREVTDRPECLGQGSVLGGITTESTSEAIREALQIDRRMIPKNLYGDGHASQRIAEWLQEIVG